MRLERPHRTERFGAVRIHELQRIIELDSGDGTESVRQNQTSLRVPPAAVRAVERDMVVVVPCMNATRRVIDVSGDGANNSGQFVTIARDEVVSKGITMYCLPVMLKRPSLSTMDI